MPKNLFKKSLADKTNEYLVGHDKHMLYVEKIEKGGQILLCMNSAGDGDPLNQPRPRKDLDLIDDKDIAFFAIKLHEQCM